GTDVVHLWDRECSLQRQRQKVIEVAPASVVAADVRAALHDAAVRLGTEVGLRGLATVEFLVHDDRFVFLEVNPRLQVEHTVTEEVLGLDLVALQLRVCSGGALPASVPEPNGVAVQCRVNLETMAADGTVRPSGGTLSVYEPPSGPGVRVDGFGYAGYRTSGRYDSLLAKVVVHSTDVTS